MLKTISARIPDLTILAGWITFFIFHGANPLWILFLALSPVVLLLLPRRTVARTWPNCFFPFAAGLLIWPLRLFYWDRADFALRTRNLLLLASLFSLYLLAREGRWFKKFLLYFNARSLKKRLLAIFIVVELLFILAAAMLTKKGVAMAGDEPHYLAISQSLARDGDLNVFNQYFRGGFKEYLQVEKLAAHGTWGKGFKKIYSYHLPGISLTLAPFFFFKFSPPLGYFLVRAYLGLFGALLAVLVYLFCLRLWHSRSLAFFATLVFSLTAPVFFYSFHVFPEVQAMLLVLGALYLLLFKAESGNTHALWAGLLLGGTIFWGVKYALFIYAFCLGFASYWLLKRKIRPALLLLLFPLLFQALFFYYLYSAYGSFSPNSVYYGMLSPEQATAFYDTILKKISLQQRWETLLDYFFDQRDGLLLYNPFYFFAFPGLLLALKNFRRYRWHLLAAVPAMLFVLNHAFSTIRPGFCPQGRYLTPAVWALLLFALIYYRESRNRLLKGAFLVLPLYSFFVTVYQVVVPFSLYQPTTHDTLQRAGLMFQNWSNSRIVLPELLPSYIKTANQSHLPNLIFLCAFVLLVAFALVRLRTKTWRPLPLLLFFAVFSLACLFPRPDLGKLKRMTGPRGLPCQVAFDPEPAAGGSDTWIFSQRRRYRLLIETVLPLKSIVLRFQNRSAHEPLALAVSLFDEPVARLQLAKAGIGHARLSQPRFKKITFRHYYQFELSAAGAGLGIPPEWLLQIEMQ